ncbi:MAG: serine protease [Rikenellaceae bacterium]
MNCRYSSYIVPIFTKTLNQEKEFNGTGFIVEDLLITASHVTINQSLLYVVFEDKEYKLEQPIYEVFFDIDGEKHDLSIFRLHFVYSDLVLEDLPIEDKTEGYLFGYSFDEKMNTLCVDRGTIRLRSFAYSYRSIKPTKLINCYSFEPAIGKKGNSGCPVFGRNGKIYGMHIGSSGFNQHSISGVLIKASYITGKINSLKQNNE